jgi:hypothetical protein
MPQDALQQLLNATEPEEQAPEPAGDDPISQLLGLPEPAPVETGEESFQPRSLEGLTDLPLVPRPIPHRKPQPKKPRPLPAVKWTEAKRVWDVAPLEDDTFKAMESWNSSGISQLADAMGGHPDYKKKDRRWRERKAAAMIAFLSSEESPNEQRVRMDRGTEGARPSVNFDSPEMEQRIDRLVKQISAGMAKVEREGDPWERFVSPDYAKATDPLLAYLGGTGYYPTTKGETKRQEELGKLGLEKFLESPEGKRYEDIARQYAASVLKGAFGGYADDHLLKQIDPKKRQLFQYLLWKEAHSKNRHDFGVAMRFVGGVAQWFRTGPRALASGGRQLVTEPYAGVFAGEGFSTTSDARSQAREQTELLDFGTRARQVVLGEARPTGPREGAGIPEKMLLYAGPMIPDFAVSAVLIAAAPHGPGQAMTLTYWWARITPDIRHRLTELGVDENYAGFLAASGGLASAYIEQMQMKKLLPAGITKVGAQEAAVAAIKKDLLEGGKLWYLAKRAAARGKAGGILALRETGEEFAQAVIESATIGIGDLIDGRLDNYTATEEWKEIKRQTIEGGYAVVGLLAMGRGIPGIRALKGDMDLKFQAEKWAREQQKLLEEEAARDRARKPERQDRREQLQEGLEAPLTPIPLEVPAPAEPARPKPIHPQPPRTRRLSPEQLIEENPQGAEELSGRGEFKGQRVSRSRFREITGEVREGSTRDKDAYVKEVQQLLRERAISGEAQRRDAEAVEQEAGRPALPVENWAAPEEGGMLETRGGGRYEIQNVTEKGGVKTYEVFDPVLGEHRTFSEDEVYTIEKSRAAQAPVIPLGELKADEVEITRGDLVRDSEGRLRTVDHVTRTLDGKRSIITTDGQQILADDIEAVVTRVEREPRTPRQWPAEEAKPAVEAPAAPQIDAAEVEAVENEARGLEQRLREEVGASGPTVRRVMGQILRAEMQARAGNTLLARQMLNDARRDIATNRVGPAKVAPEGAKPAEPTPAEPTPAEPAPQRKYLPGAVIDALKPDLVNLVPVEPGEIVEPNMDSQAADLVSRLEREVVEAFGEQVVILANPGGIPARRRAGVYHNGVVYLVRESLDLKGTDTRDQALRKIRRNYERVLAEELTHHVQNVDGETARELWEYIVEADPDGVWDSLEAYAADAGPAFGALPGYGRLDELTPNQIAEAQARYVADHIGDDLFWARMTKSSRSLVQRLIDWLRTLFANIRGRVTVDPVTGERRVTSADSYRRMMDAILGATGVAIDTDADIKGRAAIGEPVEPVLAVAFDELAEAIKEHGGITVNLWTGEQPATGYAVAPWKDTEEITPEGQFTWPLIEDYVNRWWPLFTVEGVHYGAWLDEGQIYQDASIVLPDLMDAAAVAEAGKQLAVFNLETFKDLRVEDLRREHGTDFEDAVQRHAAGTARDLVAARERVQRAISETAEERPAEERAPEVRRAPGEPVEPGPESRGIATRVTRAVSHLDRLGRATGSQSRGLGRELYMLDKRHHIMVAADMILEGGTDVDDYWADLLGIYGEWKGQGSDYSNFTNQVSNRLGKTFEAYHRDRRIKRPRRVEGKPPVVSGVHHDLLVQRSRTKSIGRSPVPTDVGDVRQGAQGYATPKTRANKRREAAAAIDRLLQEHPDPFASEDTAVDFMSDLFRTDQWVPSPPMNIVAMRDNPDIAMAMLAGLNPDQLANSQHGLAFAQELAARLADGSMTEVHTAYLAGWGMLSRMLSPFPHESAAMHLLASPEAEAIIRDAVEGKMRVKKKTDIKLHPATGKPWLDKNGQIVYYTFRSDPRYERLVRGLTHLIPEGSPGRPGIANLNSFFREFLPLMQRQHHSGVTYLKRLHEIFADTSLTGKEARRRIMLEMPKGNGLKAKVWSFLLLLTGRTDVVVIDRVQARNMWDDGRFGHIANLYDGMANDGLTKTVDDLKAVPLYEAVERSLEPILEEVFDRAGVGNPSLGAFHWMSWNSASFQEASHASLDMLMGMITNNQILFEDAGATEGRYNFTEYGATYIPANPRTGEPHKVIWDPGTLGFAYEFDPIVFKQFQSWIRTEGRYTTRQRKGKKIRETKGDTILPIEWRNRAEKPGVRLFKVNGIDPLVVPETQNAPWIQAEGVDINAINTKAGELATTRYDAGVEQSFAADVPKPSRQRTVRRAAGEEVSPEERAAARAIPSVQPEVRAVSRQVTEEYYASGRNYTSHLEPFREQATERVLMGFDEETTRLLEVAAMEEGPLGPLDVAIHNELHNRWIDRALGTDDLKVWDMMRQVVEAVRTTRGVVAVSFTAMHDPTRARRLPGNHVLPVDPIQRVDAIAEAMIEGTPEYRLAMQKARTQLQKARKTGVTPKVDKAKARIRNLERKWNTAFRKLRDKLEAEGFDVSDIRGIARDPIRAQKMLNLVDHLKSTFLDKMFHFKRNMALSALTTTGIDVLSTGTFAAYQALAERFLQALQNSARKTVGLKIDPDAATWAEFKDIMTSLGPAIRHAFENMTLAMMTEKPVLQRYIDAQNMTGKFDNLHTVLPGLFGRGVRMLGYTRLLMADEFYQTLISYTEIGAMARRLALEDGIKTGTIEMATYIQDAMKDFTHPAWQMALDQARRATFQLEGGPVTQRVKKIATSIRDIPVIGPTWLRFQMMFTGTPVNILAESIHMSPFGVITLGIDFAHKMRTGEPMPHVTRRVLQQMVNGAAMLFLLYSNDDDDPWVTGSADQMGWDAKNERRRTIPGTSVRLPWSEDEAGDPKYLDYGRWEPFSTVLSLLVDLTNAWRRGETPGEKVLRVIETPLPSLFETSINKSYFKQLGDLYKIANTHDKRRIFRMLADYESRQAATYVPNLGRHLLKHGDQVFPDRTVYGHTDEEFYRMLFETTLQRTELHRLGGWLKDVYRYDIWGREMKTSESVGFLSPYVSRMLAPTFVKRRDIFVGDDILQFWNFQNEGEEKYRKEVGKFWVHPETGDKQTMTRPQRAEARRVEGTIARYLVGMYASALTEEQITKPTEEIVDIVTGGLTAGRAFGRKLLVEHWVKGTALPEDLEQVARDLYAKEVTSHANSAGRRAARYHYKKHGYGGAGRAKQREMVKKADRDAFKALAWLRIRGFSNEDIFMRVTLKNRIKLIQRINAPEEP